MSPDRTPFRFGPSRTFMVIVGAVLAVQVWHGLPSSSTSRNTAALERAVYEDLQVQQPISDVRCTRVDARTARCIASFPDLGRTPVTARLDATSGAVTSVAIE